MADIVYLSTYRLVNVAVASQANDNVPESAKCRFWTPDHHEISIEIRNGAPVIKEHPIPTSFV